MSKISKGRIDLSELDREQIFSLLSKETITEVAARYNVSYTVVNHVFSEALKKFSSKNMGMPIEKKQYKVYPYSESEDDYGFVKGKSVLLKSGWLTGSYIVEKRTPLSIAIINYKEALNL